MSLNDKKREVGVPIIEQSRQTSQASNPKEPMAGAPTDERVLFQSPLAYRQLKVLSIDRETADATVFTFENSPDHPIAFNPGQYLVLWLNIEGRDVYRAYSICSDPAAHDTLSIVVKRVPGGRASNYLLDHVKSGDILRSIGASGEFYLIPEAHAKRHVILVGAGSGIAPLFSMAQSLSRTETHSRIDLVDVNRHGDDIIFRKSLDTLAQQNPNFRVTHLLTQPPTDWHGAVGRLEGDNLTRYLEIDREALYILCGPDGMMKTVMGYLTSRGVITNHIRFEAFHSAVYSDRPESQGKVHQVRFRRSNLTLSVPDNQSLLEAGLVAGLPLYAHCTHGNCGVCQVKIVSGQIERGEPNTLSHVEPGNLTLACCSWPRSDCEIDA